MVLHRGIHTGKSRPRELSRLMLRDLHQEGALWKDKPSMPCATELGLALKECRMVSVGEGEVTGARNWGD